VTPLALGEARVAEAPPARPWEMAFASPDRKWVLHFYDPFEFAMGAYRWRVVLRSETRESQLGEASDPWKSQPWSADSRTVAFSASTYGMIVVRDVDGGERRIPVFASAYLVAVQWAPHSDVLLAPALRHGMLWRRDGSVPGVACWEAVDDEWPITGWLPSGDFFFAVTRASKRAPTQILIFSADHGKEVRRLGLDPAELLPYDVHTYARVGRDSYSLEVSRGTWAVGSLLDRWSDSRYDPATGELLLSTYRPTGELYLTDDRWMCRAEERWLAVKLEG
jgi:hypothetical protein